MRIILEQLSRIWGRLRPAQRFVLALAGAAVIGGMGSAVLWSRQPEMKLLYGRLGEKEAADVIGSLEAQGVKYQIGQGGNSIYVPADRVHRIRMDLASKGVPSGEGVGFEIFDRSNFGISDFVQRTNFTRALQGELARTIGQVNGVRSARVMVVMPENRLLLKTADTRPTASVFVEVGSTRLSSDAVNSIRSLVANAVEGLRSDDVAVVDSHGEVLSEELKSDPLLGSASSQIKFRKHVEDYLAGKVESMLAKVLGPGNAVVRVSADIDSAAITTTEEKFDPEGQVARSETTTDDSTLTSERANGGQPVGVAANVPAAADSANRDAGTGKSTEESRRNKTQIYEINKIVTNTQKSPGAIKRVTAAVFVAQRAKEKATDPSATQRTPAEMDTLRQMVINALGIQSPTAEEAARIVTMQEVAFESGKLEVTSRHEVVLDYLDTARPILAVGVAGIIFVFFVRMIKGSKAEDGKFELLSVTEQKLLSERTVNGERELVSAEMLNELIRQKPENVAAALRGWLAHKEQKSS